MRKLLPGFAFLLATALLAAQPPALPQEQRPQPFDPAALPAHDEHQGLLIAVSPDTQDASKAKFGKNNPFDRGVLGLQVYFKNESAAPIRINLSTVRLLIGRPGSEVPRQNLDPLRPDEVADRVLGTPSKDPTLRRSPVPRVPTGKPNRSKEWNELDSLVRSAILSTDVLPPQTTTRGYFFFDLDYKFDYLSNARLEIPDLSFMLDNKALFFFEIDLAPAAQSVVLPSAPQPAR